jgi:cytochrome c biogenesis protein CcdA
MTESYWIGLVSACWLGILTSISPCPLAANIAAISYIGNRVDRPGRVMLSGLVYTAGRTVTYVLLGVIVVGGLLSIPDLAFFLQRNMNKALGPILILAGLLLLGLFKLTLPGVTAGEGMQRRVERYGIWGAGLMGLIFALSFCPVSAALFFGSLIPLALEHQSRIMMPSVYGIGTALPVVAFALLVAFGAGFIGRAFNRLTQFERWARRVTAVVFLLVGAYYTVNYLIGIDLPF